MSVLDVARSKIGAPYVWGAKGPDAFDCSGFIGWCEDQVGVDVGQPWFTDAFAQHIPQVVDGPDAGDVLLYSYTDPNQAGVLYPHTEFALGDGRVIGARFPTGVKVYDAPLDHPYEVHRPGAPARAPAALDTAGAGATGSLPVPAGVPTWGWIAAGVAVLWALDLLP